MKRSTEDYDWPTCEKILRVLFAEELRVTSITDLGEVNSTSTPQLGLGSAVPAISGCMTTPQKLGPKGFWCMGKTGNRLVGQ
jgi:hypothetical protein